LLEKGSFHFTQKKDDLSYDAQSEKKKKDGQGHPFILYSN